MTTWVLFFWFTDGSQMETGTIQNLKSLDECNRVAIVINDTMPRHPRVPGHRCIEVYTK
jgi:hypothetical protein